MPVYGRQITGLSRLADRTCATSEQIMLIKANITRLEELRDITQAFFDNGMSMEVDLKRVNINLENLKVQYDNAQAMMKQQLNMLKYIMDYPAEKEIALTPVNTDSITTVALTGLSENIYELQLSQSQVQLAERQKKIITNGSLATSPLCMIVTISTTIDSISVTFTK